MVVGWSTKKRRFHFRTLMPSLCRWPLRWQWVASCAASGSSPTVSPPATPERASTDEDPECASPPPWTVAENAGVEKDAAEKNANFQPVGDWRDRVAKARVKKG